MKKIFYIIQILLLINIDCSFQIPNIKQEQPLLFKPDSYSLTEIKEINPSYYNTLNQVIKVYENFKSMIIDSAENVHEYFENIDDDEDDFLTNIVNANKKVVGLIDIEIDSSYYISSDTTVNKIPIIYLGKYPIPLFRIESIEIEQQEPIENYFKINCYLETRMYSEKSLLVYLYKINLFTKIENNVILIDKIFFELRERFYLPVGFGGKLKFE